MDSYINLLWVRRMRHLRLFTFKEDISLLSSVEESSIRWSVSSYEIHISAKIYYSKQEFYQNLCLLTRLILGFVLLEYTCSTTSQPFKNHLPPRTAVCTGYETITCIYEVVLVGCKSGKGELSTYDEVRFGLYNAKRKWPVTLTQKHCSIFCLIF
jgi:hypothetical protein